MNGRIWKAHMINTLDVDSLSKDIYTRSLHKYERCVKKCLLLSHKLLELDVWIKHGLWGLEVRLKGDPNCCITSNTN